MLHLVSTGVVPISSSMIIPRELHSHIKRIRMVGAYFVKGKEGPTYLRYLERRPLGHGFWMVAAEGVAGDIEPLRTIRTSHLIRGGSYDSLSATYGEYYAQLPLDVIEQIVAIEITDRNLTVIDGVWHQVDTILHKRKKPY